MFCWFYRSPALFSVFLSTVKNMFKLPVVYATDRSKAVVSVLFLILCSFVVDTTGRLMF